MKLPQRDLMNKVVCNVLGDVRHIWLKSLLTWD